MLYTWLTWFKLCRSSTCGQCLLHTMHHLILERCTHLSPSQISSYGSSHTSFSKSNLLADSATRDIVRNLLAYSRVIIALVIKSSNSKRVVHLSDDLTLIQRKLQDTG